MQPVDGVAEVGFGVAVAGAAVTGVPVGIGSIGVADGGAVGDGVRAGGFAVGSVAVGGAGVGVASWSDDRSVTGMLADGDGCGLARQAAASSARQAKSERAPRIFGMICAP